MRGGLARRVWIAACVAPWWLAHAPSIAQTRGRVGFTVYVEVDGSYTTPILKSVRVEEIEPGSPAEAGGLRVDDLILKAQGKPLAGANARTVAAMVQVPPGEKLRLVVLGADGAERQVTIVAGAPVRPRR